MICTKCNKEISDTAKFCPYCGSKVESAKESVSNTTPNPPTDPPVDQSLNTMDDPTLESVKNKTEEQTQKEPGEKYEVPKYETPKTNEFQREEQKTTPSPQPSMVKSEKTNEYALIIGYLVLAGTCGVVAFRSLLAAIQFFSYGGNTLNGFGSLLSMVLYIAMSTLLAVIAFSNEKEKINTYFIILCGIAALMVIGGVLRFIITFFQSLGYYFSWMYFFENVSTLLLTIMSMATVIGVTYSLLHLAGKSPDFKSLEKLGSTINNSAKNAKQNYENQKQAKQSMNANVNYNSQNNTNNAYNNATYSNPNVVRPLKTDRGLLGYILLTIITCGIYNYYFIYTVARDVNVACAGDGKSTGGLLKFILLSILTCGIYSWWWEYSLGNRLAESAPRYGLSFSENGTTILMWLLFGMLLCGIGPFIAMNIIIKNTNSICMAYNHKHGLI